MIQLRFASTHGWLRIRGAASALGADIHFYASSQCNSMLTLIGAIPYTDASTAAAAGRPARVTLFAELRGCSQADANKILALRFVPAQKTAVHFAGGLLRD